MKTDYQLLGILIGLNIPVTRDSLSAWVGYDVQKQLVILSGGRRPWLRYHKGQYLITNQGRAAYADACSSGELPANNYGIWVDEAISGITASGQRTKIDRAAIPSSR